MQPRKENGVCLPKCHSPVVLYLALLLAGCGSSKQKAADAAMIGQQQLAMRQAGAAAINLRYAVQLREDDPAIWLLLGEAEQRLNNFREAFIAYSRANELKPSDPDTLRAMAFTGYMAGSSTEAGKAADSLMILSPTDPAGLSVRGLMALDERDIPTALKSANAILAENPSDETGILLKARAMAVDGDAKGALAFIDQARGQSAPSGGMLVLRLEINRLTGNADGMRPIYPELIKKNPGNSDMYVDYANFLYKTGETDRARKILADGMMTRQREGAFLTWAFAVMDRYEPTNVPPRLDPRIVKVPPSLLRTAAARYLLDRGDAKGAAALVSPQGAVAPDDRGIYAAALEALGRHAEAKAIVDELLSKSGEQDPEALILRALWTMSSNTGRAANAAQAAVLADGTNVRARLALAKIYASSGDTGRAGQVYRRAANDMPANRRLLTALLQFLQTRGDKDGIVGALRTFTDANEADADGWRMLAVACAQLGNSACADNAKKREAAALTDFSALNPTRSNVERGLFSPIKRKT